MFSRPVTASPHYELNLVGGGGPVLVDAMLEGRQDRLAGLRLSDVPAGSSCSWRQSRYVIGPALCTAIGVSLAGTISPVYVVTCSCGLVTLNIRIASVRRITSSTTSVDTQAGHSQRGRI
jgi:hypothetical protein